MAGVTLAWLACSLGRLQHRSRTIALRPAAGEILVIVNGKRFNRAALVQVVTGGDTALDLGSQG